MSSLVYIGTGLTLLGLCGLIWSIVMVMRARIAALDEEDLKTRMSRILPINIGALFTSLLGLCVVIVGIVLA